VVHKEAIKNWLRALVDLAEMPGRHLEQFTGLFGVHPLLVSSFGTFAGHRSVLFSIIGND
jgi:hypothetical protein